MIQRRFHAYRISTLIPRTLRYRKEQASLTVQRYLRGLLVSKNWRLQYDKMRLKTNFAFFTDIRNGILAKSQVKIRRVWLKYHAKKKEEERIR
jgi:histidinol phosphatase-like enzyme